MPLRRPSEVLVPVVRERARVLSPAVWALSASFVAASHWLGTQPPLWAYVTCWVLLACQGVLALAHRADRIPERHVQLASTAGLWFPGAITAVSMYATNLPVYGMLFVVEIASAGVLLNRKLTLVTIGALTAIALALFLRSDGPYLGVRIFAVGFAATGAVLIHMLMSRALLRAESLRKIADDTACQLALRVEEVQRTQEERALLHEQLLHAQRMEAVGTLAAGVAHDMNNVLASITGLGTLLLGELATHPLRSDVEQILEQTERGSALTRGLLAFSRRGQYRKRPVKLWDVVRGVLPILERTLPKSIAIRCELAEDVCVEADSKHLEQAMINLALNARDAMSGSGTLSIVGERSGNHVQLRVTDTGCGMDDATRLRVFEPFFTTKGHGKGTGLGLAMVWGIVQAHGGSIAVESRLGEGATFTILLPLSHSAPVAVSRTRTSQEMLPIGGRVLVVDDEPAVRTTSKRLLERMGVDVVTAENGVQAIERFAEQGDSIGVVILDMGMPNMGGAECFAKLRAQSDVPILIATGYAVDEEAQALVGQGAAFLEKPFSAEQLRREVGRLLAAARRPDRAQYSVS